MNDCVLFLWHNLHKVAGVTSWLERCLGFLPSHGLDARVLDLGEANRINTARIAAAGIDRWDSEYRRELKVYQGLQSIRPSIVVFNDSCHFDLASPFLPDNVATVNVAHVDRPDANYYPLAAYVASRVDYTACVSKTIAAKLKHVLGREQEPVAYMPLGVPFRPRTPSPKASGRAPFRIAYAGRLEQKQKRSGDLVEFSRLLLRATHAFELHVMGGGPMGEEIRQSLCNVLPPQCLKWHGALSVDQTLERLDDADCLLMFSAYEGMPLILLEAVAAGLIPVVTNIESGVGEILQHGHNGLLFEVGDIDEAARHVQRLIQNPDLCERLRSHLPATIKPFDNDSCLSAYVDLFEMLLAQKEQHDKWDQVPPPSKACPRDAKQWAWRHLPGPVLRMREGLRKPTHSRDEDVVSPWLER